MIKTSKKQISLLLGTAFFLLLLTLLAKNFSAGTATAEPISKSGFYLDTVISITLYDPAKAYLIDDSFVLCETYEQLLSKTIPTSQVGRINAASIEERTAGIPISEETAYLINLSLQYSERSHGAFDITIAPITQLWDFKSNFPQVPSAKAIQHSLSAVDYTTLSIKAEDTGTYAVLSSPDTQIDLGAIAKGFIADRLKAFLLENGVEHAIINLGGNVLCLGTKPDGTPYKIGIQKPFAQQNETAKVLSITDQSLVTSGIYERCFEQNGTLYHHVLDTSTGYPVNNHLYSVSVLSDASVIGDVLSTTCLALGLEQGMELIEKTPGAEAMFITDDNQYHYSSGFPQ